MPIYKYKAFTDTGKNIEGELEAASYTAAQRKLKSQNYYVKEIEEDTAKRDRSIFPFLSKLFYRIPRKDIGVFVRSLGTLLGANIPLDTAITDVWEQTGNRYLKNIVAEMKAGIIEGKTLSAVFGEHKDIFPPVYESMIRVGEATGSYEEILNRLADMEEKNADLKNKGFNALFYPIIMVVISIGVVLFLLTFVVPMIEEIFINMNAELPFITRFVLGVSDFLEKFLPIIILLVFTGIFFLYRYIETDEGRMKKDTIILKIPYFGDLFRKIIVNRFAQNLGALLSSNVPLLTSIEIVADTVGNELFKKELKDSIDDIKEGSSFKDSIKNSKILPHLVRGMIAAGESTDRISELLLKVAVMMESEVDISIKRLTTLLEPLMIIGLGGMVFVILLAIMLPIYQLTQHIK